MPLDGLTINVLANELNPLLTNGRVLKIYQPEETTITMQLRLPGKTHTLLISADPVHPSLHTVEDQPTNPAQPPAFCMLLRKYLEPSRLLKVEQQGFDRIVHLHFEALDESGQLTELILIFEVMGRQSNLYLVNSSGVIIDALKRFPERGVFPGERYRAPSDQGKRDPSAIPEGDFLDDLRLLPLQTPIWKWISDSFQGFSKTGAQEVVRRASFSPAVTKGELSEADWTQVHKAFRHLLAEIAAGGTPCFYPDLEDFAAYALAGQRRESYTSVNKLIGTVLYARQKERQLNEVKSSLRRRIATHVKRLDKKEAIHRLAFQEAEGADLLRQQGELLTASFHLIPSGADQVEVPDYTQDGKLVTIALDPRLTPSANVQRIFKRYHKAKASLRHIEEQLAQTLEERDYLESILLQIELADSAAILKEIELELQKTGYLKAQRTGKKERSSQPSGPERYLSPDGITILVGRNNRQNDELTFHLASPGHLWFHARNIPGSHVAVLAEGEIPQETLLLAAQLAAYFSAQRTSPKVEVDYTLRRYVRKPKGAKPGFVHYERAKTILVNPTEFTLPPRQ
ncbi:MAG TPA: fibronectin/fibrinogen-binding protein [Firmicutes bacterium]|jgi:predicted ribosome quality control (RQC) complex YloA/Tae2 family protein|nr:NFACT RNA binding domain-containing protein [Bacillota bacterium]HHT42029.1 fibronectin/fibrinogen-binding protein [Bacillota bacterium]